MAFEKFLTNAVHNDGVLGSRVLRVRHVSHHVVDVCADLFLRLFLLIGFALTFTVQADVGR